MSIWKSPIFYFGLALLLAVFGALIAPFVIDWNRYKPDLQAYGERLTGRVVEIDGPVSVRLFPFPRLQAQQVTLGNPGEPDGSAFVAADTVEVRIALDGLFAGEIRVQDISLDKPVFTFRRNADDEVNWILSPQESLRNSRLLDQVRLDSINLRNGTIRYSDAKRAIETTLEDVNATVSAPSIDGPWKSIGAAQINGQLADFIVSTGVFKKSEPLKLNLKITPRELALPSVSLDGAIDTAGMTGKVNIQPPEVSDAKGNPEGQFRPMAMQGEFTANLDGGEVAKIRITPVDSADGSTLIEGRVQVTVAQRIEAVAEFNSPRLNLDALFGAESLAIWRAGGVLSLINQAMARMPERLDISTHFRAAVLTASNETLEEVELKAVSERHAIRVQRFAANLPGRSRVLADGVVFANDGVADFGGKLALESNDLRLLSGWLWPSAKNTLAKRWTGNRGQLKLQSDVAWSEKRLGFNGMEFELNGAAGTGDLNLLLGATPVIDAKLQIAILNLDDFLPGGIALASADAAVLTWKDAIAGLLRAGNTVATRLTLQAKSLVNNGVTANDVVLDTDAGLNGLDLKSFSMRLAGGTQVTSQGRLVVLDGVFDGSINAGMTAADPLPLLQLAGVIKDDNLLPWHRQLGVTDAQASLQFARNDVEPFVRATLQGRSGTLQFQSTAQVRELASPDGPVAKGVAEITSHQGGTILQLFGIEPVTPDSGAGKWTVAFDGRTSSGIAVDSILTAYGAQASFAGTYQPSVGTLPAVQGKVTLKAADATPLAHVFGLPMAPNTAAALNVEGWLEPALEALRLQDIKGTLFGHVISGEAAVLADRSVTADIAGGTFELAEILRMAFLPWDGRPATLDTPFSNVTPRVLNGEIWLRPDRLEFWSDQPLSENIIGFRSEGRERQLSIVGRTLSGEPLNFEAALIPAGEQFALAMTGTIPLQFEKVLTDAEQKPLVTGQGVLTFKSNGTGLSPFAALSDVSGEGKIEVTGVGILRFAPTQFAQQVGQVKTAGELRNAIAALQGENAVSVPDGAYPFAVAAGLATLQPFNLSASGAELGVSGAFDVVDQTATAAIKLKLADTPNLPAVTTTIAGTTGAFQRRIETSALAGKLGYDIMAREMAELERVQIEQQRALEQEEAQRRLDEEKYKAYLEQRAEMRLRLRELKVHEQQRVLDRANEKSELQARLDEFLTLNKLDITRRNREARFFRLINGATPLKPVKSRRLAAVAEPTEQPPFELPDGFSLDGSLGQQD